MQLFSPAYFFQLSFNEEVIAWFGEKGPGNLKMFPSSCSVYCNTMNCFLLSDGEEKLNDNWDGNLKCITALYNYKVKLKFIIHSNSNRFFFKAFVTFLLLK